MAVENTLQPTPRKNWILTPVTSGTTIQHLVNLDFVSKIRIDETNFRVIIHHGITGGAGYSGSTQSLQCADLPETEAVFTKFQTAVDLTSNMIDMTNF